jgi:hypothetical protein
MDTTFSQKLLVYRKEISEIPGKALLKRTKNEKPKIKSKEARKLPLFYDQPIFKARKNDFF